ncbi:MAG TPA: hypothetical protein VFE03_06675, partial [Caulobacteraceae bacterium]|nr:hypothetical protein [Caulobacteraceae bacterium]
ADGPQALIAVWPTAVAMALAERLARGEHPPVRGFLREIGAASVEFEDAAPFRNANTPAELAAIEAQFLRSSSSRASQTEADSDSSATS